MAREEQQRRQDKINADIEKNMRGLKWSLTVFICAMGLIAVSQVIRLLVLFGVLH